MEPAGERGGPPALVLEGEHANVARLPVATYAKAKRSGAGSCIAKRPGDRGNLRDGAEAEERQGEVQVLPRDRTATAKRGGLPQRKPFERLGRQPESAEEPKAFITGHASGERVNGPSQLCADFVEEMERRHRRPLPHRLAVSGDDEVDPLLALWPCNAEVDEPHRLLG